jgi:hypothetical protein
MGKEVSHHVWDPVNSDLALGDLILLVFSPFKGKIYSRKSYLCIPKGYSVKRVCIMMIDVMGKCN